MAEAVAALWKHGGALLLLCIATAGAAALLALFVLTHWHFGNAEQLLATYGVGLVLAIVVLAVCAGFKGYSEMTNRPLSLIANEQQSMWVQAKQADGKIFTLMNLRFQVTNVSDRTVMLSAAKLRWPLVRRRSIVQADSHVEDPRTRTYSFKNPVHAHSLTYGAVNIIIDHLVGNIGKPMRIVIGLQTHARTWYWLSYHLRPTPQPHRDSALRSDRHE